MKDKTYKFTCKEVSALTNLSADQLRLLREREIIVPQLTPIRYSWNQLIELAIFSCFRQIFPWRKAVEYIQRYRKTMNFNNYYNADLIVIQPGKGAVYKSSIEPFTLDKKMIMEIKNNQPVENLLSIKKEGDNYVFTDEIQEETIYVYVANLITQLWDVAENKKVKTFPEKADLKPFNKESVKAS